MLGLFPRRFHSNYRCIQRLHRRVYWQHEPPWVTDDRDEAVAFVEPLCSIVVLPTIKAKAPILARCHVLDGMRDTPARKAWLSSLIDRIEVDEGAIRLFGRKDVLGQRVMAGSAAGPGVRTSVPKWRARKDSNL